MRPPARRSAWPPLASSPSALTAFGATLGVEHGAFVDVLGLDAACLALVPAPCLALLLAYPTTESAEAHLRGLGSPAAPSPAVLLRQLAGGTCGTVAALHALANNVAPLGVPPEAPLRRELLLDGADGAERSRRVLASAAVREAHMRCAASSAVAAGRPGERQGRHFLTLLHTGGVLTMLDGRREAAIGCGATSPASFLTDAAAVVAGLAAAIGDEARAVELSVLALVKK